MHNISKFIFAAILSSHAQPVLADGIYSFFESQFVPARLIRNARTYLDSPIRIAIYNDLGTWTTGYNHLKMFLSDSKLSYQTIDRADLYRGILQEQTIDILIMPGGESWTYLDTLGEVGANSILNFISQGGGYLGICAGAFYAISDRHGGYHTGKYGIGLVTGVAYDGTSLGAEPFRVGMLDFEIRYPGHAAQMKMVLLEGPSILVEPKEAASIELRVVARFPQSGQPAMTLSNYGQGRVFLSGPHPEIEENLTGWGKNYEDPESDWPLLRAMIDEIAPDY